MRLVAIVVALAACGDNFVLVEERPDCSAFAPPATGTDLAAAREAHRRAALRQQLRYREAIEPGFVVRATAEVAQQDRIERGLVCAQELYEVGRILFEHRFAYEDGLAAGAKAVPFRRVQTGRAGGPETTSCTSCHWRNGPAGSGGVADAAFLLGDGDRVSSADARNPPALIGAGVIQALGEEMSGELAKLRDDAIARARGGQSITIDLVTKGVSFGTLEVHPDGRVSTEGLRGIDGDLVVKPFGWKGTLATISDFVTEAAAFHFGIQSEDAGAAVDPLELGTGPRGDRDGDGVPDELTAGQVTALAIYVASLETPIMRPHERPVDLADPGGPVGPFLVDEFARGRALFDSVGCAFCHVPTLRLDKPQVTIRSRGTNGTFTLDLERDAEAPRIAFDPSRGGFPIFAFSDLKRHNLGDDNASQHLHDGIATRFYLTRPLWGVGDSSPYFYDGRSVTIDHAITRHGGEAASARDAWTALGTADRSALRIFLTALRRSPRLRVP